MQLDQPAHTQQHLENDDVTPDVLDAVHGGVLRMAWTLSTAMRMLTDYRQPRQQHSFSFLSRILTQVRGQTNTSPVLCAEVSASLNSKFQWMDARA
jgi:hypothetical protein